MGQSIRTFSGGTIPIAILTAIVALSAAPAAARPGDLDPSFDGDGIATTSVGGMGGAPYAVAVQDDGKVILAGTTGPVDGAFALVRFEADGTLDASFGGDGKVITRFPTPATAEDVEIVHGNLIVVGTTGFSEDARIVVARYRTDGALDRTFASDGRLIIRFKGGAYASDMAVQSNGKIVVAGEQLHPDGSRFAVARLTPDGVLDRAFGRDGKVSTAIHGRHSAASAVGVTRRGVLAVGWMVPHRASRLAVVRYTFRGRLDPSFSGDGVLSRSLHGGPRWDTVGQSLVFDDEGRAIIGAYVDDPAYYASSAVLLRLRPAGDVDGTFAGDGVSRAPMEAASAVRVQDDGKIVVAGGICCGGGDETTYVVARFLPGGRLDPEFGIDGIAFADFPSSAHDVPLSDMTLQEDGRIVAGGVASYSEGFLAVRLLA